MHAFNEEKMIQTYLQQFLTLNQNFNVSFTYKGINIFLPLTPSLCFIAISFGRQRENQSQYVF